MTTARSAAGRRSRSMRACSALGVASAGLVISGCASPSTPAISGPASIAQIAAATSPTPDPRVGLRSGVFDAGQARWNLRLISTTPPPREFVGAMNSDLAFTGSYAIQGNFNGVQIWDISRPNRPALTARYYCPASQSDVSVYGDLLFVSGENLGARLDCTDDGVAEAVSAERLRGLRIFDISDIRRPGYVANVQTCRGSHTHTVVEDPSDGENVYVYVSGSAPVRPAEELDGCSDALPEDDPNSALFRIEVIRVPLADPTRAAIVSSPRIFADLAPPPMHGMAAEDSIAVERARARGAFILAPPGFEPEIVSDEVAEFYLDSLVARRGATGAATAADSAALRSYFDGLVDEWMESNGGRLRRGPTQCHDITVHPAIGLAGGACEGYGLLIDISDPANPRRIAAVSDQNFSYWHSATFNNDGTKLLFSDEWGGGMQAKCRITDPEEWGADAIFAVGNGELSFRGYYKLPAAQEPVENCVAHNGSVIPIPGRDVMVQAWYQGGISVFDWTDAARPTEIAFYDRGPLDRDELEVGGSWSAYWYNGLIVASEIARGLDIFELEPSPLLTQNEIDAANTVRLDHLNAQDQPQFVWPITFSLVRAYLDQLERSGGLPVARVAEVRRALASAERASGTARREALQQLAAELAGDAGGSSDATKVQLLADTMRQLAGTAE